MTSGTVTVMITDDDTHRKGVIVTPTALSVTEGGASARYTVVLGTEPTGTVTITLGGLAAAKTEVFGGESHVPDVHAGQLEETAAGDGDGRRGR